MRKPTLRNIVVLGKFSDNKIRQIICDEIQQLAVINTIRTVQSDGTVHVLEDPMETIDWESEINLSKKIK